MTKKRILMVAPDVVGEKMAGPGMRYVEISKQLSRWYDVTLFAQGLNGNFDFPFDVKTYSDLRKISNHVNGFDFIFAQFLTYEVVERAVALGCKIIYDLYNPLPIEALVGNIPETESEKRKKDAEYYELQNHLLLYSRSGSYFVCANERQRDFWIGYLTANRVFIPSRYQGESISELVGLLPFGMQDEPPEKTHQVLRNTLPNINDDSFIMLWAGGIWDWFDPLTAIRGMEKLQHSHPNAKLVFLGTNHPNKQVKRMSMTERAVSLATELGLIDKNVFIIEGWVNYNDRANYLIEADAAVSLHQNNLETRLSFRTRILDHFWAQLPSIVTRGDWFAELIEHENLGYVLDYEDVDGFCKAATSLMDKRNRNEIIDNVKKAREGYRWSTIVAGDLKKFIDTSSMSRVDQEFLNFYIDIASINMLKKDSATLQSLNEKIEAHNTLKITQRAKAMLKNKLRY